MNITINEVAVINCTAVATVIHWEINYFSILAYSDKGFADSETELITDGAIENLHTKKLWVTGSPDSNGVQVVCVATLYSNGDYKITASEPALVLVQGLSALSCQ